jgi:hypothetical protein
MHALDRRLLRLLPALAILIALAAAALASGGAHAAGTGAPGKPGQPPACAAQTLGTLAATDRGAAARIYGAELTGAEVRHDLNQIRGSHALQSAVATDDGFASAAAVTALVYSHTHIVRLRVTRGRRLLADVGGPYIVAPVNGIVRIHGKPIGRFVMSVQDDIGLVKLIGRYTGAGSVITENGYQVAGDIDTGGQQLHQGRQVTLGGLTYYPLEFDARAFPTGTLGVWLLVPAWHAKGVTGSCASVAAAEMTRVAYNIAARFVPLSGGSLRTLAYTARSVTGAMIVVRVSGHTVAATVKVPQKLPPSGPLSYGGRQYIVGSFVPTTARHNVTVYVLYSGH